DKCITASSPSARGMRTRATLQNYRPGDRQSVPRPTIATPREERAGSVRSAAGRVIFGDQSVAVIEEAGEIGAARHPGQPAERLVAELHCARGGDQPGLDVVAEGGRRKPS